MTTRRRVLIGAAALATPVFAQTKQSPVDSPVNSPVESPVDSPVNSPVDSPVEDVKRALAEHAKLWTAGDIEGFCSYYTEDAVFASPSGLTEGRRAVLERYKKKYATKEAMGTLAFEIIHVIAEAGIASVAMRWALTYPHKKAATGFSVVGIIKRDGRWLIAHDASM